MSKKIALTIAQPCHQNWDGMTPSERGKFCGSCQKEVIDFSSMSDRQMALFFKKPAGAVCGRFHQDQLERALVVPAKRLPWVNQFLTLALPAFLFSLKASTQREQVKDKGEICVIPSINTIRGKVRVQPLKEIKHLKGKVTDEEGFAIPYATITVKGTNVSTSGDSTGAFVLETEMSDSIVLIASCIGYESVEFMAQEDNKIQLIQSNHILLGEVAVVSGMVAQKIIKPIPLIKQNTDLVASKFSVYPNPAPAGNFIKMQWKGAEKGTFIIHLVNSNGQEIVLGETVLNMKTETVEIMIPVSVTAGHYVLSLKNKKTGKGYAQKIIVD